MLPVGGVAGGVGAGVGAGAGAGAAVPGDCVVEGGWDCESGRGCDGDWGWQQANPAPHSTARIVARLRPPPHKTDS
ncbi:MAG: hypothetical protein V2A73_01975 [Pseudomonadota bacterium]